EEFDKPFGPESGVGLAKTYEDGKLQWAKRSEWADGQAHELPGDISATYLYRTLEVDEPRLAKLSFCSGDGLQVWSNGRKVFSRDVARAVAPDQDQAIVRLAAGE